MLSVSNKPFMLSVVMLNVVILNVVMLNVVMLNVVMLNVVILNVVMLNVVAPYTIHRTLALFCFSIMLGVFIQSVIMTDCHGAI